MTQFLTTTNQFEHICNAITSVISPALYSAGISAVHELQHGSVLSNHHGVVNHWTSAWSGFSLIVNRTTPLHRDWGAAAPFYDLLVSAGTHTECSLHLPDIGARFRYCPGTAIAISGRVLRHEVSDWCGGERICCAHFMKDAVHERLGQPRPSWPLLADYLTLIDT